MMRDKVTVEYRNHMEAYNRWEEQKREDHEQAIRNLKKRERANRPRLKLPLWVIGLSAVVVTSAIAWVFITLVFSQKTLLPYQH